MSRPVVPCSHLNASGTSDESCRRKTLHTFSHSILDIRQLVLEKFAYSINAGYNEVAGPVYSVGQETVVFMGSVYLRVSQFPTKAQATPVRTDT